MAQPPGHRADGLTRAVHPFGAALLLGALAATWAAGPVAAQTSAVTSTVRAPIAMPDTITVPKSLNLGSTSFFDGFGRTVEGWTFQQYGRYEDLDRLTDYQGHTGQQFQGTSIQVFVSLEQVNYTANLHPFGDDAINFQALLPLISANPSFAAASPLKLTADGFGIGDLVWGPGYQSRIYRVGDRAVFSFRSALLVMSPTGDFNKHDSINTGAGYWGVNPYVAFTYLPLPRVEFTSRLNYQYNLVSSHFPNPPAIPGLVYMSGQAGQLVYGNFDGSFRVAEALYLGGNGYFLDQLNPDRTNGQDVAHSIASDLYLGPGGRYVFNDDNMLNVNVYLPIMLHNGTAGPQFNFQFIHRF